MNSLNPVRFKGMVSQASKNTKPPFPKRDITYTRQNNLEKDVSSKREKMFLLVLYSIGEMNKNKDLIHEKNSNTR